MPKRFSSSARIILSGQAGIVIFLTGSETCSYRRIGEDQTSPCSRQDIPYLLGESSDSIVLTGKSPLQAYRILENEWKNDRAMHLLLILVDAGAHLRAKRIAVDSLEEMLATATVRQFVVHRFYARPLPGSADLDDALHMSSDHARKLLWGLLSEIRTHQRVIGQVRNRWESIDVGLFEGGYQGKIDFEQIAIEEGLFFTLCSIPPSAEQLNAWNENLRFKQFRSRQEIFAAWTSPFLTRRREVAQEIQGSFYEMWNSS